MTLADRLTAEIGTQVRVARRSTGTSLRHAASAVGLDYSTFGRIERNELENVSVRQLALACAAVGLALSVRAYLSGDPVRDAPQLALLQRFRIRLPAGAPWGSEVPMPIPGDLRALDGWTRLQDSSIGIEAESRLGDLQAIERKLLLKKRDAGLDQMILLVAATRFNREVLALHREELRATFPPETRAILAALSRGEPPSADGIVVL